jgi:hypothetical protein
MEDVDCFCIESKFETDVNLCGSNGVVAAKSTPIRPPKEHKITTDPRWWPYEYEDVDHWWALVEIQYGNGSILARYLRELDEIDPRVRRGLTEILKPTSNLFWRLHARYRFRGTPTKQAKVWKPSFIAAAMGLAKLLSGTHPIDARCRRTLAEMLDPESGHPLRLDFKQRNSGRPRRHLRFGCPLYRVP